MTHRTLLHHTGPKQIILLAGATLSLGFVSGCGDSDDAKAAVKEAGRTFTSIAVGDANATPDYSEQQYRDTEQALSKYAGDENGFTEAAAVGVAVAKKGQAAFASQRAGHAEIEALHQARVIRGMINEWLTMDAIAQAAGMFDPSEEISDVESLIEMRRDDITDYRHQMEQTSSEISRHEAKIEDLRARADEQRNQAGGLELQIPRVSAQEAAELAKQVREFTLRADQYEFEADRIEGSVAQLRPYATEVAINVEKAESQVDLLGQAADELRKRASDSQNDANEARESAQQAVQRIDEAVRNYQSFRNGDVQDANDDAISFARGAINAVRDARDAVQQVAALNKADAQQMLAEFVMRQAAGEREEAMLYMSLSEANLSGDWESLIIAANQQADELEEMGRQAYLDSAASLRSSRIKGEAAERIEATAVRLESLGGIEPEPEFEDEYQDEPEEIETTDETSPADLSPEEIAELSLEDMADMLPEDMREEFIEQMQTQMDMILSIEDPDALRQLMDTIDEQAAAMPEEFAAGSEWVKRQIQDRIDEIESDG